MSRSSASRAAQEKRGFGQVSKMRSGRYQARYTGPDGGRHSAPTTFEAKEDAVAWLRAERPLVEDPESWEPPKVRVVKAQTRLTFDDYADKWLEERPLKPRTRAHYRRLLDVQLFPTFGAMDLTKITADVVNRWYTLMGPSRPALRAHSYALLRTILSEVEQDELISKNPCHIRGAGNTRRVHRVKPASLDELATLVNAMPQRLQAMTLLAAWCGLRFGELTELRRKDVDLKAGQLRIRRAVVRVNGRTIVDTPKTDAGTRDVAIPPHLLSAVEEHLSTNTELGKESLLFPAADSRHLNPSSLYGRKSTKRKKGYGFYEARSIAGREDLRWHDLRHTGAVLAAATGATLAELMARLGHSTPAAAMRYQHAAEGRDMEIARKLSVLAAGLGDSSLGTV